MRHIVRTIVGVALLILGVVGSLVPVLPGILFFAAGIAVLGAEHAIVQRFRKWLHHDHPYVHRLRTFLERRGIFKPHPVDAEPRPK